MNAAATMLAVMVMNNLIFIIKAVSEGSEMGLAISFADREAAATTLEAKFHLQQPVENLGLVNKV